MRRPWPSRNCKFHKKSSGHYIYASKDIRICGFFWAQKGPRAKKFEKHWSRNYVWILPRKWTQYSKGLRMQEENCYEYEWKTGVNAGPLLMVRTKHLDLVWVPDCWQERNTGVSTGPVYQYLCYCGSPRTKTI